MAYKLKLAGMSIALAAVVGGVSAGIHHARELNHAQEVAAYTRWYRCQKHPTPDCPKRDPNDPLADLSDAAIDPLAIPKPATPRPADNSSGPLPPAEYFATPNGRPR